jgi:predicted nucleic acid-binding protein
MPKQKVYLETTVFNYYFDTDRDAHLDTVRFFEAIGTGVYEAYTSAYTVRELQNAPEPKKTNMLALIDTYHITVLEASPEAEALGWLYIQNGVIPEKKTIDAFQIAVASLNHIDLIVSFNFSHINKLRTKLLVPAVNQTQGYKPITIIQPQEV